MNYDRACNWDDLRSRFCGVLTAIAILWDINCDRAPGAELTAMASSADRIATKKAII